MKTIHLILQLYLSIVVATLLLAEASGADIKLQLPVASEKELEEKWVPSLSQLVNHFSQSHSIIEAINTGEKLVFACQDSAKNLYLYYNHKGTTNVQVRISFLGKDGEDIQNNISMNRPSHTLIPRVERLFVSRANGSAETKSVAVDFGMRVYSLPIVIPEQVHTIRFTLRELIESVPQETTLFIPKHRLQH